MKEEMNNLFRKSIFSIFGFLAGLALLVAGFITVVCNFPEKIWFLGLAFLIPGLILTVLTARYFTGIVDKETSSLIKNLKKERRVRKR